MNSSLNISFKIDRSFWIILKIFLICFLIICSSFPWISFYEHFPKYWCIVKVKSYNLFDSINLIRSEKILNDSYLFAIISILYYLATIITGFISLFHITFKIYSGIFSILCSLFWIYGVKCAYACVIFPIMAPNNPPRKALTIIPYQVDFTPYIILVIGLIFILINWMEKYRIYVVKVNQN